MKPAESIFDIITQSVRAKEEVPHETGTGRSVWRVETRLQKNGKLLTKHLWVCVCVCAGMFASVFYSKQAAVHQRGRWLMSWRNLLHLRCKAWTLQVQNQMHVLLNFSCHWPPRAFALSALPLCVEKKHKRPKHCWVLEQSAIILMSNNNHSSFAAPPNQHGHMHHISEHGNHILIRSGPSGKHMKRFNSITLYEVVIAFYCK